MNPDPPLPPPTTPAAPAPRRRRLWPWIVGLILGPFVILGVVVLNFITLDRDARLLRGHVMAATGADWQTKVQLSVGRLTLGAARTVLFFVHEPGVAEARAALDSVQRASVGVYELAGSGEHPAVSREELFVRTDRAMQARGWTRLVGVADHADHVLIYVSDDLSDAGSLAVCLAVVSGRNLVVVSTRLEPEGLIELARAHVPADVRAKMHLARR